MRKWIPLLILVAAQFIVIIDTTILNVSVGILVDEYRTSVTAIQAAIASYALVTAILLLTGGRAAETLALRRVLVAGLGVYAVGSVLTSLSGHVSLLYLGYSGLEGAGAALVLPSAVALSAATYSGSDRRVAFGIMGAMGAAAAASGPLVAGVASTYASWRVSFAVTALVAVVVIASAPLLPNPPRTARKRNFDMVGALLSMGAVGLIVLGLINVSRWGWWTPRQEVEVVGIPAHPLGLAPTLWVIGAGIVFLAVFWWWSLRRTDHQQRPLVDVSLLRSNAVMAGAGTQIVQSLILAGVLFIIPVFLVVVQRRSPLQTAIALLPLTTALLTRRESCS
jgi:MFS family permease